MVDESISERIAKLKANKDSKSQVPVSFKDRVRKHTRKFLPYILSTAVAGAIVGGCLERDYLTKRQDYPERNVLYTSSNEISVAGNSEIPDITRADKKTTAKFYSGGGIETKVGTYAFETTRESIADKQFYNMDNSQKMRIASALQKVERFQEGMRFSGALIYREEFAEIVTGPTTKSPDKYIVYKFAPERALSELDIDVIEQKDGSRQLFNRLVESRNLFGWFSGKTPYRDGTLLEDYPRNEHNAFIEQELLQKVRMLDSLSATKGSKREQLIGEIRTIDESLDKITTYATFEDGFLKIVPQESTIYLGHNPTRWERYKDFLIPGLRNHHRLRVENHWDVWPGRLPWVRDVNFGSGRNVVYPFDKYNNGGYTLEDKFGVIAEIDIKDFILHYGQDILYEYFIDLNGDGNIDKQKELIGQVLARSTHDERIGIEQLWGGEKPSRQMNFTVAYSFMAPEVDKETAQKYFRLCAYIETLMPDQIKRGEGQHSLLGLINDQRSDIMLYQNLTVENLSRALTQESTLAVKQDIIKVLNAAQRPYAQELARTYGIEKDFEGKYHISPFLKERYEIGPLPLMGIAIGGGLYGAHRLRKRRKGMPEDKKLLLPGTE